MTRTDRDNLRTLSLCHYVLGGLCFVFGLFPIVHLIVGIALINDAFGLPQQQPNGQPVPMELVGWIMIGVAVLLIVFHWSLGVGLVLAGRCLSRRERRTFCLVVAGFSCLFQPLGLVLGIFTFIVLLRPGVREAFERPSPEPPEFDTYPSE